MLGQDTLAIAALLLIVGSLLAVVSYYIADHSKTFRDRLFMRSVRQRLEAADEAIDVGLRYLARFALTILLGVLCLVVMLAVIKWALEELAR